MSWQDQVLAVAYIAVFCLAMLLVAVAVLWAWDWLCRLYGVTEDDLREALKWDDDDERMGR